MPMYIIFSWIMQLNITYYVFVLFIMVFYIHEVLMKTYTTEEIKTNVTQGNQYIFIVLAFLCAFPDVVFI